MGHHAGFYSNACIPTHLEQNPDSVRGIGGGMELGESLEQTAARELLEEANLTAECFELLNVLSGEELYFKYPNGDETYTVIALYRAVGVTGTLRINDGESHRLQYFPLDALPELEGRAGYVIKKLTHNKKFKQEELYHEYQTNDHH